MIVLSLYTFVTGYGPVQGADNFRRILGFLITLGLQPYNHKPFDCFFFLIELIDIFLLSFLDFVPI
jgi:hypothetical protein